MPLAEVLKGRYEVVLDDYLLEKRSTPPPRGGVARFKSHDKRKTTTSNTAERWAMRETIWKVVGGENK